MACPLILLAMNDIDFDSDDTGLTYHGVWLNYHIGFSPGACKLNCIKDIQPSP
jgi:hypothetical protein